MVNDFATYISFRKSFLHALSILLQRKYVSSTVNLISLSIILKDICVTHPPNLLCSLHNSTTVCKAHARARLLHECLIFKNITSLVQDFFAYVNQLAEYGRNSHT